MHTSRGRSEYIYIISMVLYMVQSIHLHLPCNIFNELINLAQKKPEWNNIHIALKEILIFE